MGRSHFSFNKITQLALLGIICLCSSGCVGLTAQLLYVIKGEKVDPEFPGLKGKKVAVVCVANTSTYQPDSAGSGLATLVEQILRQKMGSDIKLVRQAEIEQWIDKNNWDQQDFRDIGRGVKSQMVLAIDLNGLSLHEDQTLFKGRANVTVTVYDMTKGGEAVFRHSMQNFTFPTNGGQHVSETNESQFRNKFLFILAGDIARLFYPYEMREDFAREASLLDR